MANSPPQKDHFHKRATKEKMAAFHPPHLHLFRTPATAFVCGQSSIGWHLRNLQSLLTSAFGNASVLLLVRLLTVLKRWPLSYASSPGRHLRCWSENDCFVGLSKLLVLL